MNVRSALMNMIRRFATRRKSQRLVEKRTYVFILVPFDFRGNGRARKAELDRDLIDNGNHADGTRTNTFSTIIALDSSAAKTAAERDLNNAPGLDHDLMWTWFLPNPLWPPNKNNRDLPNLFRFEQNGFNAKTKRKIEH